MDRDALAQLLADAGYTGLFLSGDASRAGEAWDGGAQRDDLLAIVEDERADDLVRLLASEVLHERDPGYPPPGLEETLGRIYSAALGLTGDTSAGLRLAGNLWGLLYPTEDREVPDDGPLAAHLIAVGALAVPHLERLLGDDHRIYYEGSQEAMIGNGLRYRVKDVAAYLIGRITGKPVAFHADPAERDAEIERALGPG